MDHFTDQSWRCFERWCTQWGGLLFWQCGRWWCYCHHQQHEPFRTNFSLRCYRDLQWNWPWMAQSSYDHTFFCFQCKYQKWFWILIATASNTYYIAIENGRIFGDSLVAKVAWSHWTNGSMDHGRQTQNPANCRGRIWKNARCSYWPVHWSQ